MKRRAKDFKPAAFVAAVLCAATLVVGAGAGAAATRPWQDYPEREEINRSFRLPHGGVVVVSGIAGPVEVEATDGETAEVNVVRSAQTRAELDCYRTAVEQTARGLEIRHEQFTGRKGCGSIRSRQRVHLRVPRATELRLRPIAGNGTGAGVEGRRDFSNGAGHARVEGARSAELSNLAHGLTMTLGRLADEGVRVSNVVGGVELDFAGDLGADLRLSNLNGDLRNEIEGLPLKRLSESSYGARVGAGGAPVRVSNVNGAIRLRRL